MMSDKIYFNTSEKFSIRKKLVNISTRLHHTVAPGHARKTAKKLFLTPVRTRSKNAEPAGLIKSEINTTEGVIKTYVLGSGPVWVLNHGWSGSAGQYYPLMEHIVAEGFTALAYDQPAHGESGGAFGHIPGFVRCLEAVLDTLDEEVAGVIAHSMGTAATLECHHAKIATCPLILIAPVLDYTDNLLNSVRRSGYSMKLFEEVVGEVEQQYHYPLHIIDPYQHLMNRNSQVHIVHDKGDRFTKFSVSEQAAREAEHVVLTATRGQGHGRIMKSEQVRAAFNNLV